MDAVYEELGGELSSILNENQINTVDTFLLLTQEMVMRDLGLKLGSWLRIDRAQQGLKSEGSSRAFLRDVTNRERDSYESLSGEIRFSSDSVKTIIESELSCQKLRFGKLAEGRPLDKNEKNLLCRTVCSHIFKDAIKTERKITHNEKRNLAKAIVEAYDCLKCDVPGKPAEADFFWEHNGESKGPHTGFIQNWIRNFKSTPTSSNQSKHPTTVKRSRRSEIKISEDEVKAYEELRDTKSTPESQPHILQLLAKTFSYRESIRASNKPAFEIISEFPDLVDEEAIHQEFDLMFPDRQNAVSFDSITSQCLMLKHEFGEIANDEIRAVAKILSELTQQGARKADPEDLPPVEDFLSVFVRWCQIDKDIDYFLANLIDSPPYVFCDTFAYAEGVYYAIINGVALHCGHNFYPALDIVLKSYKVFNYQVPSKAKKVVNFFDVLVYDACKFSRIASVNNLCERIRKSMKPPNKS